MNRGRDRSRGRDSGLLGDDRGAVTVEAAVAVCGLVAVLGFGVAAVMAVVGQLRCTDAAREAARLVARGDGARVGGAVEAIAPPGARWEVRREGDTAWVEVAVSRLGVPLRARAYAVVEPGVESKSGVNPEVELEVGPEPGVEAGVAGG